MRKPLQFVLTVAVASGLALLAPTLLAPVGVNAATGSTVNIVDPLSSARKARVTTTGQLSVADIDPVSGSLGRVTQGVRWVGDGSGPLTVDGSVRPAAPSTPWRTINDVLLSASIPRVPIYVGSGTGKLALTSMTLGATAPSGGSVLVYLKVYLSNTSGGDCQTLGGATFGAGERLPIVVPVGQSISLSWPTPLSYTVFGTAGRRYCVDLESLSGPSGYTVYAGASGYTY